MNQTVVDELAKIIKKSAKLNFDSEKVISNLENIYGKQISDFSDILSEELKKEQYAEVISKFEEYGPLILKKFKLKPESNSEEDPDYSEVFSRSGFLKKFKKNSDSYDLCRAFFFIINSLSAHIDPGECNEIIEDLAQKGKLHLIQIHSKDALTYLWENDSDYFYDRLEEHFKACKDKYPDRIAVFKKTDLYKSWLEDREAE